MALRVASPVLGSWSPVRTGNARVRTLASGENVLVGISGCRILNSHQAASIYNKCAKKLGIFN